ncbi:MAG: hypothetical protein N2109_01820 [Fimbriimonadales bacterium]|nr:hypothetical protein [Fimbriimonadales bacterium]
MGGERGLELCGVDVFVWSAKTPELPTEVGPFRLELISNRGTRVFPPPTPDIDLCDWPRARYLANEAIADQDVDWLLARLTQAGWIWTKSQKLYRKDGADLFSHPY